jgi:hypothetical protein
LEHRVWKLRLLVETGFLPASTIDAPAPPVDLDPTASALYRGFVELLSLRWLTDPGVPSAYSWRFAAAWCSVPEWKVGAGMHGLLRRGLLQPAGTSMKLAYGKPITLFRIGSDRSRECSTSSEKGSCDYSNGLEGAA